MIVTFYSYKGGTGRSMALANIAALLAVRGHRVLAVDFDLEAPGLWRYFSGYHETLEQQPGLIDLLTATAESAGRDVDPDRRDFVTDWRRYITQVRLPSAVLTLMTSGQLSERYSSRVLNFNWTEFFQLANGGEFLEGLRKQWRDEFDFTLIDSRTGITDSGGICTIMLPDLIVPVFVSNRQSFDGAVDVIRRAQAGRRRLAYDRPPAAILPLLSKFESLTEYENAQEWLSLMADRMQPFYGDWLPSTLTARHALERTKLPYVSYFSFGETLPVLTESTSDPGSLTHALTTVSLLIEHELANAQAIIGSGADVGFPPAGGLQDPGGRQDRDQRAVSDTDEDEPGAAVGHLPFRDRYDELERVLEGLTSAGGPHFWLVIAPPKIGKTWFLSKVGAELKRLQPLLWSVGRLDVSELPAAERGNVAALLGRLFRRRWPVTTEPESLRRIAQEIISSRKSWLCLLDRAELVDVETAIALRSCVSQIYERVKGYGTAGARVCLIVASRREDKWRSVIPRPRMSGLVLTEFSIEIIQDALRDLADEMARTFNAATLWQSAIDVHKLCEGHPILLNRCLEWIRAEEWMEVERLRTQELFVELVQPYIKAELLSRDSLFSWSDGPRSGGGSAYSRQALEHAFRVLAPYRIFTQSQLRHYLETDSSFADAQRLAEWSIEDLWRAISGTALLKRPLDEPWQELNAAIRRLLFRYYIPSDERRAETHREAGEFAEAWADKQSGKEQVIGLVEALWHEAVMLRLSQPARMEEQLTESARKLVHKLRNSAAYSAAELRSYAAERIRDDEELQDAIGNDRLLSRLIDILAGRPAG